MQDDVEAFGCKLLSHAETNAVAGTCHQSPETVAVEIALYGRGSSAKVDERNETEECIGGCCNE